MPEPPPAPSCRLPGPVAGPTAMSLPSLDHVAFWVADRDAIAARCERHLGMHVIDRQDAFSLVGRSARHGKLTLFDAPGPRELGVLRDVGLRVADIDALRARLPAGSGECLALGEGISVTLEAGPTEAGIDLAHVRISSSDPEAAVSGYVRLGFLPLGGNRVGVGAAYVEVVPGDSAFGERPLLNHIAVRVASAEVAEAMAHERGFVILSRVDAANTRAVFVQGPDGVRVEFVEHKPTFSLV